VECPDNDGEWRVVPHDADNVEGVAPSFVSCDEYAVHQTSTLRDNLKTAMIAREDPLMLTISTKGDSTDRPMYRLEKEMLKHPNIRWVSEYKWIVEDRDAGVLYISCGLPEDYNGDFDDEEMWRQVNPASWISIDNLRKTRLNTSVSDAAFKRKHLNMWVPDTLHAGIYPGEWDSCRVDGIAIPEGARVWTMTDLGFTDDWTAHVRCAWVGERLVIEAEMWEPPGNGEEIDVRSTADVSAMRDHEAYQVVAAGVDPWNAKLLMQDWQMRGWATAEVPQKNEVMVPASTMFLEAIRKRQIAHNGDERLRWHILNLRRKETIRGWRFTKPDDNGLKVDAAIAAIGAVWLATAHGADPFGDGIVFL
jgi:phage terminase large subunit-like protein